MTAAARTSPRWCASWPPSTASTSARSPAPASAAGSASRTCSPPPSRPAAAGRRAAAAAGRRRPRDARPPAATPRHLALRGRTEKMSRLRTVIAKRMVESLQVSAQLTTVVEVDVTRIAQLRQQAKARLRGARGREAVVPAVLREGRRRGAQGAPDGQRLDRHRRPARSPTTTPRTSASRWTPSAGCWCRSSTTPATSTSAASPARSPTWPSAPGPTRSRPDELGGGTFTLTNTGSRGALFDTPIINQPQVAILGTGSVVKRPVVVEDPELGEVIAVRSMVYLALTYDHRIVDGADAARFLTTVKERLEAGQFQGELGLA